MGSVIPTTIQDPCTDCSCTLADALWQQYQNQPRLQVFETVMPNPSHMVPIVPLSHGECTRQNDRHPGSEGVSVAAYVAVFNGWLLTCGGVCLSVDQSYQITGHAEMNWTRC